MSQVKMQKETAAAVMLVVLVVGLGVGYLAGSGARQTTTLTSVSTLVTTFVTTSTQTTISTSSVGPITQPSAEVEFHMEGANAIAVDPNRDKVYVMGGSSLLVLNGTNHSIIANVTLPAKDPEVIVNPGLAVDTSTGMVYASVSGEIVEVNGTTNQVTRELPMNLYALAVDSATDELWGTQVRPLAPNPPENGSLVAVNLLTGSVIKNLSVAIEPTEIAIDSNTGMVYAVGCSVFFTCNSEALFVNAASGVVVNKIGTPSTMAFDQATDVVYFAGGRQLVALNGTNGFQIFQADPQTCSPFLSMAADTTSGQLIVAPQNYDYLLIYDGTSGALVNMYSLPASLGPTAFNPDTGEIYATSSGRVLAILPLASTGNVNATLIGSYQDCLPI